MLTVKVKMYAVYFGISGMIHDCKCIADLYSRCPRQMKEKPPVNLPLLVP